MEDKELLDRNMDTIILNKTIKQNIINDINLFLESKNDYIKYGIPYKRNYMFSGKPGTGKTSLARIIATMTNRSIYNLSFDAQLTDTGITKAISKINENSILLLEDIDCVFTNRTERKSNVSFSALLNILDGVNSRNNLITIITTNHIEKLDNALLRAGRIDMHIKFGIITNEQVKEMMELYKLQIDNNTLKQISNLCQENKITISTLSGYLFGIRNKTINNNELINGFKTYLKVFTKDKTSIKHMYL
jgi:chaperone BCS1